MTEAGRLLLALQHGDSAFPSGGFAFSWGLETLKAGGLVTDAAGVAAFIRGQLSGRWASSDRFFLQRAAEAGGNIKTLIALDREIEALTLATELREGSRRGGRTLLRAHASLDTPGVAAYQSAIKTGEALGHLPMAQAVVWAGVGLALADIQALSAYTLASGLTQAAVRLTLLGPLEAQGVLLSMGETIAGLLDEPLPGKPHGFTPAAEIAVMRHETGDARLFAN